MNRLERWSEYGCKTKKRRRRNARNIARKKRETPNIKEREKFEQSVTFTN
jgi:hypothetical protein